MPKKTIRTVVESGNHYIAQIKRNQPNLHDAILRLAEVEKPTDNYVLKQRIKGKDVVWQVSMFEANVGRLLEKWANLRWIIRVQKRVIKQGKITKSNRFFISDVQTKDAEFFHEKIRQHWLIENQLHWIKDVVHREDKNRIRTANGPINMSIISSIAINIHRRAENTSITESQTKYCFNILGALRAVRT